MKMQARLLVLFGLLLVVSVSGAMAQQGDYRLGQVLGLRYFTFTQGDPEAYAQRVQEVTYPFYDRHVPGVDWVLLKGDRGAQSGGFAYFFNFDTLERRNFYFPQLAGP